MADNGEGSNLWLLPTYQNFESQDMGAEGVAYGVDIELYGLTIGADVDMGNSITFGGLFSAGNGSADGQQIAQVISNDFDFYSLGLYSRYKYNNFEVIADTSYSWIDNDVDAGLTFTSMEANVDTTNFNVGLTALYRWEFGTVGITPHIGARYTHLNVDDFTIFDANSGAPLS